LAGAFLQPRMAGHMKKRAPLELGMLADLAGAT